MSGCGVDRIKLWRVGRWYLYRAVNHYIATPNSRCRRSALMEDQTKKSFETQRRLQVRARVRKVVSQTRFSEVIETSESFGFSSALTKRIARQEQVLL